MCGECGCGEGRCVLRGIEAMEREKGVILLLLEGAEEEATRAGLLYLSSMAFANNSVGPSSSSVVVGCF